MATNQATHVTPLPSFADIEATLRDLLTQFAHSDGQGPEQIARFARAGAEAITTQLHHRPWLTSAESAAVLGVSEAMLRDHVRQHDLPAARTADEQPAIHRRDLSLYRLSQQLGGTETDVTPITPPVAWSADLAAWGLDPWDELTPG